jgi:hypothetical protein
MIKDFLKIASVVTGLTQSEIVDAVTAPEEKMPQTMHKISERARQAANNSLPFYEKGN